MAWPYDMWGLYAYSTVGTEEASRGVPGGTSNWPNTRNGSYSVLSAHLNSRPNVTRDASQTLRAP